MIELELEFVPAPTALAVAQDVSTTDGIDPKAIGEIARTLGSLIRKRLFHRDLKLSNLLVCTDDDGVHVWMLDTADVRAMRRPVRQTARMLDRLAVQLTARGIELPVHNWRPVIRAALRPFASPDRRAILQRLRLHLQQQCAQYRTPFAADPR